MIKDIIAQQNSTEALLCSGGKYCATNLLEEPTGDCAAGYFCTAGSYSATPTDGIRGDICGSGTYCPAGTNSSILCPAGTYSNQEGNDELSDCIDCPNGYYCPFEGMSVTTELCPEGFYCPQGTSEPTLECTAGHYCPEGSDTELECEPGTYQNLNSQSNCKLCEAGYFCPGNGNTDYSANICPAGSYCPEGTETGTQYLCPEGTYSNVTLLESAANCTSCDAGKYCEGSGNIEPDGLCDAGYYCTSGSNSKVPRKETAGEGNDICPSGAYCPQGSPTYITCTLGTYATGEGNINSDACVPCPPGQYCASVTASDGGSANCDPGYVCYGGAFTARPNDTVTGDLCDEGYYCVAGSDTQEPCVPGTYNPSKAAGSCLPCPEGLYCPDQQMTDGLDCFAGSYCPEGTDFPIPCPAGTYSTAINLKSATNCTDCPLGKYCYANTTAPIGDCSAGYFCDYGSYSPSQDPCPIGHYCPKGTTAPVACDAGTFNPSTGSDEESDCIDCTAGSYCETEGLSEPTGLCNAGFYCPSGSISATEISCLEGFYCDEGSASPKGCNDGTYQPSEGQSTCISCPERFYCFKNDTSLAMEPIACPIGSYCPSGTAIPIPCPSGYYGNSESLASADECTLCPSGKYCINGIIQADCSAGYLCISGNYQPNPVAPHAESFVIGDLCPAGSYCPEGTTEQIPCPENYIRTESGASILEDCIDCPAGYRCAAGNPDPIPCPAGFYCPTTASTVPCDIGTYSNTEGAFDVSTCKKCPEKYWCSEKNITSYDSFLCPAGHYCAENTIIPVECPAGTYIDVPGSGASADDCLACPIGHYCEGGTASPIACSYGDYCPASTVQPVDCVAGKYCPMNTDSSIECPIEHYCPGNVSEPLPCTKGHYCPIGSTYQTVCPGGYRATDSRESFEDTCIACPAGTYQNVLYAEECTSNVTGTPVLVSTIEECLTCDAGYICTGLSSSPKPNSEEENGYICPAGFYCPAGAVSEVPCPKGTFNPNEGGTSVNDCSLCPENTYNHLFNATSCLPCTSSSSSPEGSSDCICIGQYRAFQPTDSQCICQPGYEFILNGQSVSDEDGTNDCQPIVYSRCAEGQVRASDGTCVNENNGNCEKQCNGNDGIFNSNLGTCECTGTPNIELLCDDDCRQVSPQLTFINGVLQVSSYNNGTYDNVDVSLDKFSTNGNIFECPYANGCNVLPISATSSGLAGTYGLPSNIGSVVNNSTGSTRRRILNTDETIVINPAIICLRPYEGIIFDLEVTSEGISYPVYMKDNLLNSNPDFDYGAFRELATAVSGTSADIDVFFLHLLNLVYMYLQIV